MMKANQKFFSKRGEQETTFNLYGEDIKVKITIPTNKQHDQLMEQFTILTPEGVGDIKMADFVEEQMVQYIVELPFEVPIDENMKNFKEWKDTNLDEKRVAVSLMDSKLREMINNAINGATRISQQESGN